MSIIDELIFDRTNSDLVFGTRKSKYDYRDYNRVGEAVNYVVAKLNNAGYFISATGKTDWVNTVIPRDNQITTYRQNISKIVQALEMSNNLPTTNNNVLTILGANQIEKALYDANRIIDSIMRWTDVDSLNEIWDNLDAKGLRWGSYFLKN